MKFVSFVFLAISIFLVGCGQDEKKEGTPVNQVNITAPEVTGVSPASYANNNFPVVSGTAQGLVLIKLYSDSTCSTQIGIGNSIEDGSFAVTAQVADNTTTTIYATAHNGSYSSACSTTYIVYTELSSATAGQLTFTSTTPASPSESLTTTVRGTAIPDSTVDLYTTVNCTGSAAFTGTANQLGEFAINVTVTALSSTTFRGISRVSGLSSLCSTSTITYNNVDTTAPARPVVTSITPVGPSNNNSPVIAGTAEASSTVRIYYSSNCTGPTSGTGTANALGAFSITLSATANTNRNYYASATDSSGNVSPCSTTFMNYIEDSTAPGLPQFAGTTPPSPSNSQTPKLNGTAEANATVNIYTTENCTGAPHSTAQADSGGAFSAQLNVAINTINKYYATATDLAGNVGGCTTSPETYVMQADLTLPIMPVFTSFSPLAPSDHNNPVLTGEAEANTTVNIYTTSDCSGAAVATGVSDVGGSFSIAVPSADNVTTTYYGKSTNASNQFSPCTPTSISYTTYSIPEGMGWFYGSTATTSSTNINQATMYPLVWGTSEYHSTYYDHSRTTNAQSIQVKVSGNYLVALNIPYTSTGAGIAVRGEVRVNGVAVDVARSAGGFISNYSGQQRESSVQLTTLLTLNANDIVDVGVIRTGGTTTTTISNTASLMMEYVDNSRNIFFASADQTTNSTDLNQSISYPLQWTSTISGSAFTHNNFVSNEEISFNSSGHYMTFINVPLSSAISQSNVKLLVKLNGTILPHGVASQGYINGGAHSTSSIHWFGVIPNVMNGDVLTVETVEEAATGTVIAPAGYKASIYLEEVSSSGLFMSRGNVLQSSSDWNSSTTGEGINWENDETVDTNYYTHSTLSNSHLVTFAAQGDYLLMFNAALTSATQGVNVINRISINGSAVGGAESKSAYISNQSNNDEASNAMVYLLRNASVGNTVQMLSVRESVAGSVTSSADACLVLRYRPNSVSP